MELSNPQRRYLRGLAHGRRVVVTVGNAGLTPAVLAEIDQALAHHELVKVRIHGVDRETRQALTATMLERTGGRLVQSIGHVVTLYRAAKRPRIALP